MKRSGNIFSLSKLAVACLIFLCASGLSSQAKAEEFAAPTYANVLKLLVRYGALNINDDATLNSYAIVQECKMYKHFYHDDFRWKQFQAAMRQSIRDNIATFPTGIAYNSTLQLDRYDFKNKMYRFTKKTAPRRVNLFSLKAYIDRACEIEKNNIMPSSFQVVLDQPMSLSGIPLSEEDGKTLLHRMDKTGNKNHLVFTRFNFRIIYIEPLFRKKSSSGQFVGLLTQGRGDNVRMDAHLSSVDFYEDEEHKKLIYTYVPN